MSKKKLVIAVDFNGTCVTYAYPEGTGEDIGAVPVLKRLIAEGHQLVLMTGIEREGEFELPIVKERWDDMLKWVEDNGLTFVGINRNPLEKYRSKKLTADIYIDDHCLGIPTIFDEKRSNRPFVDWDGVEQMLEMMNVLPVTPRTHVTVKRPSFYFE